MAVIGIDVGRSATKIATESGVDIIPSAVCEAMELTTKESARTAKDNLVTVNGRDFFVGNSAITHSANRAPDALSDDWIESDDHAALLIAAYQRAKRMSEDDGQDIIVLGLPSRHMRSLRNRLAEVARLTLGLGADQVFVLPQPLAAFFAATLDEQGVPTEGIDIHDASWAVVDIGYYTTDYGLVMQGEWAGGCERSSDGASTMATEMQSTIRNRFGIEVQLRSADAALRNRAIRIHGATHDLSEDADRIIEDYASHLDQQAQHVFGAELATATHILLAGGGSAIVQQTLRRKARWAHSTIPQNPRFAVAEGLRRYGLLAQHDT